LAEINKDIQNVQQLTEVVYILDILIFEKVFGLAPTRRCESLMATHCVPNSKLRRLASVLLQGALYWRERISIVHDDQKGLGLVGRKDL